MYFSSIFINCVIYLSHAAILEVSVANFEMYFQKPLCDVWSDFVSKWCATEMNNNWNWDLTTLAKANMKWRDKGRLPILMILLRFQGRGGGFQCAGWFCFNSNKWEKKTYFQCEGILCGEEVSRWLVSARHPLKFVTLFLIICIWWKQKHVGNRNIMLHGENKNTMITDLMRKYLVSGQSLAWVHSQHRMDQFLCICIKYY